MSTSKHWGWRFGLRSVCSWAALLAAGALPVVAQTSPTPPAAIPAQKSAVDEPRDSVPVFHVVSAHSELSLIHLQSRVIEFSKRIEVVDGFNPEILNVAPVSPTQIRIRAENTGVTAMTVKDETGAHYTLEIFVEGDVRELKAHLRRLFPGAALDVSSLKDSVVVRGWVTEPEAIPQIMAVAKQMYPTVHNQMRVGGVPGVQMHVKILEVQRSKLQQLGVNFVVSGQRYAISNTIGGVANLSGLTAPFGAPPVPTVTATGIPLQFAVTGSTDRFQGFIDALTTESLAKTLAEPTLLTTSGRPASLLSGGEFPILVPSGLGTTSIQYKEFGVRMEAIPTVLGNGRLRLDIAPEVSERDFSSSVNVNGFVVPGVNTRRVNTQVEMSFGETVMIGGLISQRRVVNSTKIPILGELPIIGAAFSKKSKEMSETELLIMVTPEMAAAMRRDQVPHDVPGWLQDEPTAKELFLDGMLEVPSYGPECPGCENGMPGGMASHQGMPGPVYGGNTNCAPPENGPPSNSIELAPPQDTEMVPTELPAGDIQTMSGRTEKQRVIQAGGDPFRVPTRRDVPSATSRAKVSENTDSSSEPAETRSLPGLSGSQRPSTARPASRVKSNAPRPESVRGVDP